jgi:alkylation response protein AidB-like acyl-CoA dehydrogenase
MKTRAERVLDDEGTIKGYRINGQKQFITNGGVAELFTILANTPGGPSFFIVEGGTEGLIQGRHEDKHGIRASDTSPLVLEDLYVPVENLLGGVEGQGLKESNQVFGYTRLMVATFGLGGGMAALEKAIAYSKERVQFGTTLSEKQGYTHRLIVPNAVRLEAARAFIEQTAYRLDTGDEDLPVEGSISKYFATEAGDAMANDAIQALGGYGYMREYEVEKIKRDTKITTIFEGTSEIQRNIIAMYRLRSTVRSKGGYYSDVAQNLEALPEACGGLMLAGAVRALNEIIVNTRREKLTKSQYVMFLLADMMTWVEVGEALCHKAAQYTGKERTAEFMNASARIFMREAMEKVYLNGLKIGHGCGVSMEDVQDKLRSLDMDAAMKNNLRDMDFVADELVR